MTEDGLHLPRIKVRDGRRFVYAFLTLRLTPFFDMLVVCRLIASSKRRIHSKLDFLPFSSFSLRTPCNLFLVATRVFNCDGGKVTYSNRL